MTSNIIYLRGIEPGVDPVKFRSRSSMLSLIGIEGVRVEFPLTRGLVSHATLCGITAVTVWFSRESKLVKLATYFAAIFGILMTDGRSALFFTVFVIAYGQFFRFARSEEHTSELQSLMRISYAVFCLHQQIKQK